MSLRDRLDRLKSVSAPDPGDRSETLRELRERLDRLMEPRKQQRERGAVPIERLVTGETLSTPHGDAFQVTEPFPLHSLCGEISLSEIREVPTYPAHLLSGDERLKEFDLSRALFLDTETTGLAGGTGTFVFMIGLGFFDQERFVVRQLFMRDYSEEKACLTLLNRYLDASFCLVTFNGRHYDIPLLETRFILSKMESRIREMPDFDLLFPSRKIWKGIYENCRLVTLESKLLGMPREDDVPSEWIPQLYFEYIQTGDARRIHRVFYHNRMDILAMVGLLGRIHLVYHDPQAARPRKGMEHFSLGRLFWDHGLRDRAIPCFETALARCDDDLAWEVMRWLSLAFKKTGQTEKALSLWEEMATWPRRKEALPLIELAKYCEHRLKDAGKAMEYVERALEETPVDREREREALLQRKRRLEGKRGCPERG